MVQDYSCSCRVHWLPELTVGSRPTMNNKQIIIRGSQWTELTVSRKTAQTFSRYAYELKKFNRKKYF